MNITELSYTRYQSESSRDSNSQLEHVTLKGDVLGFAEEWRGYHPAGGGGRRPSSDYRLGPEHLEELGRYLEEKGLAEAEQVELGEEDEGPRARLGGGRDSRSYGQRLTYTSDAGTVAVSFGYRTSGPRDAANEEHPLNRTLNALHEFLKGLRSRAERIEKSPEELEAERFYLRNGYAQDELPTSVSELVYWASYEPFPKKYDWERGETPFLWQYSGGDEFFVRYRTSGEPERRVTYRAEPPFFEQLAQLLVEAGLHQRPPLSYCDPGGLPLGETRVQIDFRVQFNGNSNWRHKYELTHYDTPEIWEHYEREGSFACGFKRLDAGLRELLSSPLLTKQE